MDRCRLYGWLLTAFIGLAAITTSCNNNDSFEGSILRPIEDNVQGIWTEWKCYQVLDGKYIEDPNPEKYILDYELHPGGEMTVSYSYDYSALASATWSVDENEDKITIQGNEYHIYRLTANEMEVGLDTGMNVETGEIIHGDFRWIWRRLDRFQDTYATRLMGRWRILHRYEIENREWNEIPMAETDDAWCEYRFNGTCTYYENINGRENRIDYDYWGAMDYVNWDGVFQAYHGIDGESYNDYRAFTLNPDGTMYAYTLDYFDAGGEGVADVGRKYLLARE